MNIDDIVKKLQNGSLTLPLHNCKLTQCGTNAPIIYSGYGLIDQNRHLQIQLRIFTEGVDTSEALMRQFDRPFTPGTLVPDSGYYDFEGFDIDGEKWFSKRLSINPSFGASTYIQIEPWQLTKSSERNQAASNPFINAFIPLQIDLPWHQITQFGDLGWKRDKFSYETISHEWSVRKTELGTWVHFCCKAGHIKDDFVYFIQALSILSGKHLTPTVEDYHTGLDHALKIRSNENDSASLLPPIEHRHAEPVDAHAFITSFLGAQHQSEHRTLIHRMWHRILRARENDIENSSLVLSVAIEGLVMKAISNNDDEDVEFKTEINSVMPRIEATGLPDRVLKCIQSSFGNAVKAKPKSTLQRLIKQNIIDDTHIAAWGKMRNLGAHGHVLDWETETIQRHLQRFHSCLDLFYRLIFFLIGYSGKHRNYSVPGWPTMHFPNPEKIKVLAASPTSADSSPAPNH